MKSMLTFASRRLMACAVLFVFSTLFLSVSAGAQSAPMRGCAGCHPDIYSSYLRHGMSASLGKLENPPTGKVTNPKTGWIYELKKKDDQTLLEATGPDGGVRLQRLVGQIGAGVFDISYAAVELDPITGREINRLFFAPVETVTGHGLELSPFEHSERPAGVNMALNEGCLTCHTDTAVTDLPGASASGRWVSPGNALGADAFDHLEALGCDACHGDGKAHLRIMSGLEESESLGLPVISEMAPARQRDVCARCHLQGDVRFQMVDGRPSLENPLPAVFPTLVTTSPGDDFRFVGQLERLALSSCFQSRPSMTCSTCHDPHVAAQEQGLESFEQACLSCHGGSADKAEAQPTCSRSETLQVSAVTGREARSPQGCLDCHVRRSEPFDLPGVETTDHFVRRTIPKPAEATFRSMTNPDADLKIWDDGRLARLLKSDGGRRWQDGVLAMAYVQSGRFGEALERFDRFPAPGSAAALRPTAPSPLKPVETWPTFHELRAMALLSGQRPQEAQAAFGDALKLDPKHPSALLGRARMSLLNGSLAQAMQDTQQIIEAYPEAEGPWQLRAVMAQRLGRPDFQIKGLEAMVSRWPVDAGAWLQLAQAYRAVGDDIRAEDAMERVRILQPSLLSRPAATSPSSR